MQSPLMVTPEGRVGSARERLLGRVVDHMLDTGVAGSASLRTLAAEIGTSHRMLLYHFGNHRGLIEAVVMEVEQRQRVALAELGADPALSAEQLSLAFWRRLSSPSLRTVERLFFQLYGHLLEHGASGTAARLSTAWYEPATHLLVRRGYSALDAERIARVGMAVCRGLLLELLATGDERAADAAAQLYVAAMFGDERPVSR